MEYLVEFITTIPDHAPPAEIEHFGRDRAKESGLWPDVPRRLRSRRTLLAVPGGPRPARLPARAGRVRTPR